MRRHLAIRLLVLPLILAVFVLGTEAVAHAHDISHDEDHCTCQVCHVTHAAIPQPSAHAQISVALVVARFAPAEIAPTSSESLDIVSSPRAPPASA